MGIFPCKLGCPLLPYMETVSSSVDRGPGPSLNPPLVISRRGDKFDRSMTRGKLLGNNVPLFIFISILIMTQLHPRDPENREN